MRGDKPVVYIVEDDASFRKSVERLIRASGFETVAFDSAKAFLSGPSIRRPSCLLLDVRLPDMDGLSLQTRLKEKGASLPIIFMTGHGSIPMGVQAMKQGAIDFLPKPFSVKELKVAITRALDHDVANRKKELCQEKVRSLIAGLTAREREVMTGVIAGKLNKQIAADLGITEKTVKVHRGQVMQKTKVSSVAELVRLAGQADTF